MIGSPDHSRVVDFGAIIPLINSFAEGKRNVSIKMSAAV